jgi:iron complex outermembrane receptor protein
MLIMIGIETFRLRAACASLLALAAAVPAWAEDNAPAAQQPAAGEQGGGLNDIVVTARRRAENLQDVPVAVTALSGGQLAERGVVKLEDLRFQAPSFQVQPGPYGSSVPAFQIRGQRQQEALITQDPSVGIYVDEVYQARVHGVNQSLLDLENVQVLKGPQGTLFGRNTTGGALLVQSHRPTDRFEGQVTLGLGNYGQREITGIVNLPVSDTLRLRAAAKFDRHDGYVTNVSTGQRLGTEDNYTFRIGALFTSGDFESYTTLQGTRTDGTGVPLISQGFGPVTTTYPTIDPAAVAAAVAAQNALGFYQTTGDLVPNDGKVRTFGASNISTLKLGEFTLKNVLGYRKIDSRIGLEFDGSSLKTLTGLPFFNAYNFAHEHQFSEELQLQGKLFEDRLSFVLGGYYFREKGNDFQQTIIGGYGISQTGGGYATNRSASLFGQADLKITSALTATAGIRYSWDRRTLIGQTYLSGISGIVAPVIDLTGLPPAVVCNNGAALPDCKATLPAYKDHRPTWNLGLSYRPSQQILVYANVSRGYRSGGYNLRGSLAGVGTFGSYGPFKPELVTNYEGGLKLDFELGSVPVRANLAAYHQDYKNIQRTIYAQFPGEITAQAYILNAAAAKIDGGELELSARPARGFDLTGFLSYIRPKYSAFSYVIAANPDGSGTRTIDGKDFPFAGTPTWQFGGSARYEVPLDQDGETAAILVQYYHQDRIFWSDNGEQRATSDPYGLIDLRLEWNGILGHPADLALYVKNLGQKKYKGLGASGYDTLGFISYIPGTPRTFGGTVTVRF